MSTIALTKKTFILFLLFLSIHSCYSQARWIFHPTADPKAYGVYHFRKQFVLAVKPRQFIVRISGDDRYELFVNGKRLSAGPARGDVAHWRYETVDLAPALRKGRNTLAAVVWNQGKYRAWAQVSCQPGLWVEGGKDGGGVIQTDSSWKVIEDLAYLTPSEKEVVVCPFERFQADRYPWGWQEPAYDDRGWVSAKVTEWTGAEGTGAEVKDATGAEMMHAPEVKDVTRTDEVMSATGAEMPPLSPRRLVPRNIPFPEETPQRFATLRRSSAPYVNDHFISGTGDCMIPAHDSVTMIIDQGTLTTAWPELLISGGKGARVTITYAEAMVDSVSGSKGQRDEVAGKVIRGNADLLLPDGGGRRLFRPLWYRTFRYVGLTVATAGQPLRIHDLHSVFTAYPFKEVASFACSDTSLAAIWKVGWRTARLCGYETYMDCPYYEQLQYIGDTRIQALITYNVSGDDRLVRNAIEQFSNSFIAEGLTQSRYPSSRRQIIPPFSLFWIDMLHDYWRYRPDPAFVRQYFDGVKKVLDWHAGYIDSTDMLGRLPFWNFVDWPKEWPWKGWDEVSGIPDGVLNGHSSILSLQYVYALQKAVELFTAFHMDTEAAHYRGIADRLKNATLRLCWDEKRKLLAGTPEMHEYSQHANVMAVLVDLFPAETAGDLISRTAADSSIVKCTYYYRFYLNQAMKHAGLGDRYVSMLQPWKDMLQLGLTTFAERPEPTRSDCHAWSASPNYDFLATVAGIEPASPGFATVRIAPNLGPLQWAEGKMPVPAGLITFTFRRSGPRGIIGEILLPNSLSGSFVWNGKTIPLHGGRQKINVE